MAFDGSVVCALTDELNRELSEGGISKITQPDPNALMLTIKKDRVSRILFISVNPSLPVMYLTDEKKEAPITAPAFCMLLRKHLMGGRIVSVTEPSLERIVDINIEHYDELGDLRVKTLTVELMGKYSNIIFRDGNKILDSIKHVSSLVSSVREVLPGREYFIPETEDKLNPFEADKEAFLRRVFKGNGPLFKGLYSSFTGLSPALSQEICFRAGLDSDRPSSSLEENERSGLWEAFCQVMDILQKKKFSPEIVYKDEEPIFFGVFRYSIYEDLEHEPYESVSALLKDYYGKRSAYTSMRQKSADLRQIIQNLLNKDNKKYDLQLKQIKDTKKRDKYKVYGELLTSYGYSVEPKATSFTCENFYTGEEITIPLDPTLSAIENGKKYFDKYSKLKRTDEALSKISQETQAEISHLESIKISLDNAENEADLNDIKREMRDSGYIKSHDSGKKKASRPVKSAPLHFVSSDGFDIYVGKNNYQNELISFKMAQGNDWWFHAKKIPGSHVIVKTGGKELPDRTFEEAAALAAYYSSARNSAKVDVDYTLKKNLKKPPGSKPGYVIYHTNYSMAVKPALL